MGFFFENYRVSCTSVATARSSASRMESPNPSSSSARTLAGYLGLCSTVASTRRVSLKSVTPNFLLLLFVDWFRKEKGETGNTDGLSRTWKIRQGQRKGFLEALETTQDGVLTDEFFNVNRKLPRSVPAVS